MFGLILLLNMRDHGIIPETKYIRLIARSFVVIAWINQTMPNDG